eukprot:gene12051-25250_t
MASANWHIVATIPINPEVLDVVSVSADNTIFSVHPIPAIIDIMAKIGDLHIDLPNWLSKLGKRQMYAHSLLLENLRQIRLHKLFAISFIEKKGVKIILSNMLKDILKKSHVIVDYYSGIAIVFSLLCLLMKPILNQSYYENERNQPIPPVIPNMASIEFRYILVAEMSICGLLILNAAIDAMSDSRSIFSSKGALINLSILGCVLFSGASNFYIAVPNGDYLLMYSLYLARLIFIPATICSYVYRYGKSIWQSPLLIFLVVLAGVGCVLKVVLMTKNDAKSSTSGSIGITATVCQLLGSMARKSGVSLRIKVIHEEETFVRATTPRSHSVKSSSVVPIDNEERRSYRGNKNNRSKGKSAENVETNSNTITTTIHTNNDNYDDDTFLGRDFTLQD